MVQEPATILSVKPTTSANEDEPALTSSSVTSPPVTSSADDSAAEDEPDHTSQPLPPADVSQYFVSTTGNQRKQELPALHKAARCAKTECYIELY